MALCVAERILALIGRQRGYRVVPVVPENISREKRALRRAFGGEVALTPEDKGLVTA